jgi:hypothetical protein
VVFIPTGRGIKGGVCTQQSRGCKGNLKRMTAEEAADVRVTLEARGIGEQPWLTLVFKGAAS